jgi:hypothetical protein
MPPDTVTVREPGTTVDADESGDVDAPGVFEEAVVDDVTDCDGAASEDSRPDVHPTRASTPSTSGTLARRDRSATLGSRRTARHAEPRNDRPCPERDAHHRDQSAASDISTCYGPTTAPSPACGARAAHQPTAVAVLRLRRSHRR